MYTLFTDETNAQPADDVEFFVYGGVIVPNTSLISIHKKIDLLRKRAGFGGDDILKFNSRSRPDCIDEEDFADLKRKVIDDCICRDVKFVAMFVHHGIARRKTDDEKISFGLSCVIRCFEEYLLLHDDYGTVVVDQHNKAIPIIKEKFQNGLFYQSSGTFYKPERILGYSLSCIGSSHFASLSDLVIGSFRYCLNNPKNPEAAREMYHQIKAMKFKILQYPRTITVSRYQKRYDDLKARLCELEVEIDFDEVPF